MKKILVTGGLGYIGSHTVVDLLEHGFQVEIIDDLSNSNISVLEGISNITKQTPTFHQVDLKDYEALQNALATQSFDGIIHFAAYKAVGESQNKPIEYYENNLLGLLNLLKITSEKNIPNLIFSSSCTVYGQADELPISENAPLKKPESVYGKTKQFGEEIIGDVANLGKLNAILLRYFNPIGAHPSAEIGELPIGVPNNLIPYVTQTAAGIREKLFIWGNDYPTKDGTCIRDYIYVMDLANAHTKAMQRLLTHQNETSVEIYNLGTGTGNTVLEVIETFEKINNVSVPYQFAPRREGDITAAWAKPTLAEEKLGWKAETSLETALQTTWNWQQKMTK
ncbi:MAG: UDP-glucose 4-epimerase GalE [Chryseobacterium sp.]|nr:MAG: UDP-glucose 4-epimerase GalE [Chryseobacterium sp.]